MKKLLLVSLLIFITTMSFAGTLQFGPAAVVDQSVTDFSNFDFGSLTLDDFRYGLDLRLSLSALRFGLLSLYEVPGFSYATGPKNWDIIATMGLNLDLAIFQFGLVAGPEIQLRFADDGQEISTDFDIHIQSTANINLGIFSPGIILGTSININDPPEQMFDSMRYYFGFTLLFNFIE